MKVVLFLVLLAMIQAETLLKPKSFEMASNQFALELWQKLSAENHAKPEPENLFFSPYSIATALSMVYVGTDGKTRTELGSALKLNKAQLEDPQELATEIQKSSELMFGQSDSKPYNLSSANALAISDTFQILDSYKKLIAGKFSGKMFSVDFAKDSAGPTEQINQWVSDKTNQKIDKFLQGPMSSDTVMALLNAVYFKGSWKLQFDPKVTYKAPFFGLNGKQYPDVWFMRNEHKYNYTYDYKAMVRMVELSYKGDISLYAFLSKNNGTDDFVQMKQKLLTTTLIEGLIQRKYETKITLLFPKFSLQTKISTLKSTLSSMGVNDLFQQADLGGLLSGQNNGSNILINSVEHLARIEMNEEGAEAAAVTGIQVLARISEPIIMAEFNRPFVFVIRHNANGRILFVGEVIKFGKIFISV